MPDISETVTDVSVFTGQAFVDQVVVKGTGSKDDVFNIVQGRG